MESRVTSKPTKIGDKTFILKKMDPRLACWLFATLASKAPSGSDLLSALGKCSKPEFDEIQGHTLRFIFHQDSASDNPIEIPIIGGNGMWAIPELANDPSKVFRLTSECILFNISPFLDDNKSTDQPVNQ